MEILSTLKKNDLPTADTFDAVVKKLDFPIDKDYLDFIQKHNGAAGFLNDEHYVLFWEVVDLIALNPYYKHDPKGNNYFFFGSDGSSLGYAFDKINDAIVAVDFYEFGIAEPTYIAPTFKLFIDKLSN